MSKRLGFVGLGVMGGPMAGHLHRRFGDVTVWNRSPEKTRPLLETGARVASDLAEVGRSCDVVFVCVNRSEDVREVLEAMCGSAAPGTLFVDHSTIAPPAAVEIGRELADRGFRFVDAPVTGGSMGAQNGQLTVFCGGTQADFDEAKPFIDAYAKRCERLGDVGAGQLAKMANQIAVAGALLGLCESMSFAAKAGLDLAQVRELIAGGAAGSWAFENYGPKLLARDWSPGFSVKNQRKDFAYCLEAAQAVDAALPGTRLVDRLLRPLQEQGKGEWATVALFEQLMALGADD